MAYAVTAACSVLNRMFTATTVEAERPTVPSIGMHKRVIGPALYNSPGSLMRNTSSYRVPLH
jgi:hypothetical protein